MDKVFKAEGETIPTFLEKPLICFGKFFHDAFKGRQDVKGTQREMEEKIKVGHLL